MNNKGTVLCKKEMYGEFAFKFICVEMCFVSQSQLKNVFVL